MEEQKLNSFRSQLLRLKTELENLSQSSSEQAKPVTLDQTSVGRLSRMDSIQGQQMAIELKRSRQSQLAKIKAALKRIDDGKYGFCLGCKNQINRHRLEFDPTHTLCVDCAEKI